MKKLVFILSLCMSFSLLAQTPATPTDKIKSCLADYWVFQEKCKAATKKFCPQDESVKRAKSCAGIDLKAHSIEERYIAIASYNGLIWLLDSSKLMIQVK